MFGGFSRIMEFCSRLIKNREIMKSLNLISSIIIIRLPLVVGSDEACL